MSGEQRLDVDVEQLRNRVDRHRALLPSGRGDSRLAADQQDAHRPVRLIATKRGDQRAGARERSHRRDRDYLHQASSRRWSRATSRRSVSAVRISSRTRSSSRSICSVWRLRSCSNSASSRSTADAVAIRPDRRRAYAGATRQSVRRVSSRTRPRPVRGPAALIFAVIGSEALIDAARLSPNVPLVRETPLGWLILRRRAMTLNELPNTRRVDRTRHPSVLVVASGEPGAVSECLAAVRAHGGAELTVAEAAPDTNSINVAIARLAPADVVLLCEPCRVPPIGSSVCVAPPTAIRTSPR